MLILMNRAYTDSSGTNYAANSTYTVTTAVGRSFINMGIAALAEPDYASASSDGNVWDINASDKAPGLAMPLTYIPNQGNRCGVFGDSMGDYNWSVTTTGTSSFDPKTNLLSITVSSGHNASLGALVNVWHRSYASLTVMQQLPVYDVLSTTVYRVQLNGAIGAYPDLPNGALISSPTLFTVPSWLKAAKGWMRWICAMSGQRFSLINNQCQSGDTTAQMLVRLPTVLAVFKANGVNTVVMHGIGVNDLTFDSTATSVNDMTATIANIKTIFDTFRLAGMRLIISTQTPAQSPDARAQKSIMVAQQALNRELWSYARRYGKRVTMLDAYPVIVNPTDASGLATTGYVAAADGIHLTNTGAYKIAKSVLAQVLAAYPSWRSGLPHSTLDSRANSALSSPTGNAAGGIVTITAATSYIQKNQEVFIRGATGSYTPLNGRQVALASTASGTFLIACAVPDGAVTGTLTISPSRQLFGDPLCQGTPAANLANGVTGLCIPLMKASNNSGNTGTLTCAASVATAVASPDGRIYGKEQILTVTAAALNDRPYLSFNASVGTVDNQMTPGRYYEWEAQVRYTIGTAWANAPLSEIDFEMNIGYTDGGVAQTARGSDLVTFENVVPLFDATDALSVWFHLRTAAVKIPSTATITSCQVTMSTRFQAAMSTDSLVIAWSRFACRDVTPDGPEA